MALKPAAQPVPCQTASSGIRLMRAYAPLTEADIAERVRRYNSPEERKRRLLMYVKPESGPWRAEFTRSICGSVVEAEGLWQDTRRPIIDEGDIPTGLIGRIEDAAMALGFSLRGMYWMGLREAPHSHLLPGPGSEGLVIVDGDRLSPMVVSAEHMLIQCGELPFVFPYGRCTGLRQIFANALLPDSFF